MSVSSDTQRSPLEKVQKGWRAWDSRVQAAALVALGLTLAGSAIGWGVASFNNASRVVTVRGLAERDVTADLATWTLAFAATGNNLAEVQKRSDAQNAAVRQFLQAQGFSPQEVRQQAITVNQWVDNNPSFGPEGRANISIRQSLQLRTSNITAAQKAHAAQAALVRAGVALEEGNTRMVYSFTKLNSIKPAMIADATRDARKGAEQFAHDSDTSVGSIRRAQQGYFSIGPREGDAAAANGAIGNGNGSDTPFQKVRVVTTIDFELD